MTTGIRYKQLILLAGDIILLFTSLYLAPVIRFGLFIDLSLIFGFSDLVAVLVSLSILYVFDFYRLDEKPLRINFIIQFASAIFTANLINTSIFYLFHLRPYSTAILLISSSLALISLVIWRHVFIYFSGNVMPQRILMWGAGAPGMSLSEFLKSVNDFELIGFVDDDPEKQDLTIGHLPVLGKTSELMNILQRYHVNTIVVDATMERSVEVYKSLVEAKFNGVAVYELSTFYEKYFGIIPVLYTTNMWLGFAEISGVQRNIYNTKLKKIFDKTMALVGIIFTSPLMLVLAVLIKLESQGPILYKQTRIGWDEKPFELFKFRSMAVDAEEGGAVWAQKNDPRMTRMGKIMRSLRIDELPQLWNVLVGDMSFVGPRPERPEFVKPLKKEIPYYTLRHSVKPGITGWAQVNYPYGATVKDAMAKLEYDLYYIKNASPLSDLVILIRTVNTVLLGKGAR